MRKLILSAVVAMSFNATASNLDNCYKLEELGEVIMTARQSGRSMGDLMKIADGNELVEAMVFDAFEAPLWSTDENKQKEINNFKSSMFKMCYKNIKEAI